MPDINQQAQPAQSPEEPKPTEGALDDKQLESITGGTKAKPILMNACATGTHLKEASITH